MISTLYIQRTGDNPEAQILLHRFNSEGFVLLKNLIIEKVFRLEGISNQQVAQLKSLFCHPATENAAFESFLENRNGPIVEVGYQRAVTDPELPSILRSVKALGVSDLAWVRLAHRYQFLGIDQKTAEQIVTRYLYNPQVQVIIPPNESWKTLKPQGQSGPVEVIDLEHRSKDDLIQLSENRRLFLNADQMKTLQMIAQKMNRPLTDAEVEMFAQTWSDHCFHTTWKSLGLLQKLWDTTNRIHHPLVLSVFEDNAGAISFYDGWALTLKGETHNSPSAISPYGGIMTKHGGVIRDTLGCGQGAWPIGGSTIMGLGDPRMHWNDIPKGSLHPKTILAESIRGTADYNNPMGIPMMFPMYRFHRGYTGKCFALGHSIGLIPANRAKKGKPVPGDYAILIGGLTGRDGLHGATVSSSSMTSQTATTDAAHVQIGQPIEERKFMEAIPVLRNRDCIRAITDLGAAGLSSAAGEMGSETGVWINLAWIPLKTEGMLPWEIWISESQERMLLCVPPEKCGEALQILEQYEVPAHIIGKFTTTKRCQVIYDESKYLISSKLPINPDLTGQVVINLSFKDLRKGCPLPKIEIKKLSKTSESYVPTTLKTEKEWLSAIGSVLGHINICDQSLAGTQFDSTIQGITTMGPYKGMGNKMPNDIWVATPIRGKSYGVVTSVSFNPFYGEVDPPGMAKLMILDSISKLVSSGVDPSDVVLCDNFYTPHITPEVASMLSEMVSMCCTVSGELNIPFISGKDSSSGTFIGEDGQRIEIPPTLAILALGRLPNVNKLIDKPFKKSKNHLFLAGPLTSNLGGSVYLDTLGHRGNNLPSPSLNQIKNLWKTLRELQKKGTILSASVLSEGGLIRRLFEMSLGSGLGCKIELTHLSKKLEIQQPEIGMFAEMIGTLLVEVPEEKKSQLLNDTKFTYIGQVVKENNLTIQTEKMQLNVPIDKLIKIWEKPFREILQ